VIVPSGFYDGFVLNNGAKAYAGDAQIYTRLMPMGTIRDMLIACDNAGVRVVAERDGCHYTNFDVPEEWTFQQKYEISDFRDLDIEAEKLYAVVDSPEVIKVIKLHLSDKLYLYESRDGYAMVMHSEATKAAAVSSLAAHWGIEQKEIVAFGDDKNDIDLLQYSGIGIAMGNAVPEVKAAADLFCDTNENDGIAKWLEENLL
jgi:hypothetical protein